MSNESKIGRECKVTVGATNLVLGMGTWTISGGSYGELDDTEFGDDSEQILRGIRTGGEVTFSGNYKKDDTQGQDLIKTAFWAKSDLTDIRLWVDDTSYYTPNSTTLAGGGLPVNTPVSHLKVMTEPTVSADKNDLVKTDITLRLIGAMRLI